MKVNLVSTLNNLSDNETEQNRTTAKKEKKAITFKIDDFNNTIKIVSPNKVILYRTNNTLECTMFFELNKEKPSIYTFKEEGYTLEINIKTTYLKITNNTITINYTVTDSNAKYEYKIEMSEINK